MADAKISALANISGGLLADGDKFPVADASDLTASYHATALNIKTYVNTAPVFAAGSASAGTWPKLTASANLLSTPEVGALELDANCLYGTTDAGNRGYIPVRQFIRCDGTRTFAAQTSTLFNSPANGRLTLEVGTYLFEGMLYITSMSSTSGNIGIDILGGGGATIGSWLWHAIGIDASTPTNAATQTGTFAITKASAASVVSAGTGTAMAVRIKGTFEVTGAGTIQPQGTLVTNASVVVAIGSYMMFERIGSTTVVSLGQWD